MAGSVGIMGGTFNPVHTGHLIIAEQAREQLGFDEVRFMPAAIPPHKQGEEIASGHDRLKMLQLAITDNPAFTVSDHELTRTGVSYTVETLRQLSQSEPNASWTWIIGGDNLPELPTWHDPAGLFQLAEIAVVPRPGYPIDWESLRSRLPAGSVDQMRDRVVDAPLIDIASRTIRQRVRRGRAIRYLVPRAVEEYIHAHRLYRNLSD